MHKGTTKDTGEQFEQTVEDWEGAVIEPFDKFLNRVFSACIFVIHVQLMLLIFPLFLYCSPRSSGNVCQDSFTFF